MSDYYTSEINIGGEISEEQFQEIYEKAEQEAVYLGTIDSFDENEFDIQDARDCGEADGLLSFWDSQAFGGRFSIIETYLVEQKIPYILNSAGNDVYGSYTITFDGNKVLEFSTNERYERIVNSSIIDKALEIIEDNDMSGAKEYLKSNQIKKLVLDKFSISATDNEPSR